MNVFTVAKKLEKDTSDLYNNLALHSRKGSLRDLMAELAVDHQARYRTLNALTGKSSCPADATPHLRTVTDTLLKRLLAAKADHAPQDMEAFIRSLMDLESTTADFYEELRSLASSRPLRKMLQEMIEREQQDCSMVEEFYEFVNAPNEFLADAEFSNLDEFHQFGRQIG